MKEQIINYITENKTTNFQNIYKTILENSADFTKPELRTIINELESDGEIISAFNSIYHKASLQDFEGYIQWNMNKFCWVDSKDKSNSHGVTFDIPEEALTVANKKQTLMASYSKGKIITNEEGKKFFYSTDNTYPQKDLTLIYFVDEKGRSWQLNNGMKKEISPEGVSTELNSFNKAKYIVADNNLVHEVFIGLKGDKGIESKVAFEIAELKIAPPNDSPQQISSKLKDLRKKKFVTIDGLFTKDRDDEILFENTKTGHNLYVGIANVSQFVLPGTEQDIHASQTATSFYLAHQTVHMLARNVAEKQCSLNPGEEKSVLVCKMSFDKEGSMTKYKFFEALTVSHACLTYDDVNLIFKNEKPVNSTFIDASNYRSIKNMLVNLNEFRELKPFVGNKSSWLYNRAEFELNENGKIEKMVDSTEGTPADKLVEFSMLHANVCAAQQLFTHYPEIGLFRNQSVPANVQKPKSAFYGEINDGHWGLDAELYTHFTSPIRRYCDLIVHRLIKSTLAGKHRPYTELQLSNIAKTINVQQNKSKQIESKVSDMLIQQYVQELFDSKKLGKTLTVLDITENGALVTRNKQKIEYFIPEFKLTREIQDKISNLSTNEDKKAVIKEINDDYKVLGFVDYFSWLDERKNVSFYIQSKQQIADRKKEKDAAREISKVDLNVDPLGLPNIPKI